MNAPLNLKEILLQQRLKGVERKAKSTAKKAGKGKVDAYRNMTTEKREALRKDVLGLVLTWTDTNPLGDDGCSGLPDAVSRNPNKLVRAGVEFAFKDATYRKWLINQEFEWEVDVSLHYSLPNSKTKSGRIDPIYFVQRGKMEDSLDNLSAINARIEKWILSSTLSNHLRPDNKNKGVFEKAVYRISCVGL
jgi:hypothetical protein